MKKLDVLIDDFIFETMPNHLHDFAQFGDGRIHVESIAYVDK